MLHGWQDAAPVRAIELYKMAQFLERTGWRYTPEQYRAMRAGDVAFLRAYWGMTDPAQFEGGARE